MSRPERVREAWALRLFSRADLSGTEQDNTRENVQDQPIRPSDANTRLALAFIEFLTECGGAAKVWRCIRYSQQLEKRMT
ncbi:hypothetical protein SNOG_12226 [Parastagonospora nodorum SN15]|uniref:Uncharacterized protein n=1 Tax=Phaeosphaeria nodorum (strain SN15 / ATCC MYA-4574 / FGSC 10173) TaxID=321614 RepID=Q0U7N8_PHANO|nr:hypothetical protein SNOG_12226 [Parastagonospora nodorum SN15]EAT80638.1 hypothetical protein SNOG_12226 [Parastagonospora nodorum SN15]